jgi:hypothetical protein
LFFREEHASDTVMRTMITGTNDSAFFISCFGPFR